MSLSKELLEILACPKCKQEIEISADEKWLICGKCKLKYPIKDEIPVMLIEEAQKLDE
jgi:uncharacterized protein YbaR (Trm112 family)